MTDPLAIYLRELREIRHIGAGVKEESYYGVLENLLNAVGKPLKPRVRCLISIQNQGAGEPDGGLFTSDQAQRGVSDAPLLGQVPARGVIEVKGTGDEVAKVAETEQVARYWSKYGQVLVTNYRDFLLIGRGPDGARVVLEGYKLAPDEAAFWAATGQPEKVAAEQGERFIEYLKRVMLHAAPLSTPKDVAWFLASYARDAKARIEEKARAAGGDLPALATVRDALQEALGIKFEGDRGDRFFRSTLVQTLFYGVFSAWVLWSKKHPAADRNARFNWHEASWSLHVPMIRALFEQLAMPSKLGPLGLVEVLDWTGAALNRVDRAGFFERFHEAYAVQYFYEPFLEAFDPMLRKDLGVWYTPPEVVKYMVARVDTALRQELDIPDGLADPRVYVLDPCCGTGAYVVEVLRRIHETLKEGGEEALIGDDVKRAAMERVFGFEILPAPFVVAHLQLGVFLQNIGAPLSDEGETDAQGKAKTQERVGVYLTNALTGWKPPKGAKQHLMFPELELERDAAEQVKREKPILVILGNPPYNAFAGVSPTEEAGLVEPYKAGLNTEWGIKKFNLDDLYVRFFRLAERRIAEATGRGVVYYISNYSYLGDPSFVVMRRRFLAEFDALWFDCLNGDSRETGKLTPDGKPDPSVFSTEYNREGIRVGTAVGLMVRGAERKESPVVRYREFWGVSKRADLMASLQTDDIDTAYATVAPREDNRYSFRPSDVTSAYQSWPKIIELCSEEPISGLSEKRKGALMAFDRDALERRMRAYYDRGIDWQSLKALRSGPTEDAGGFVAKTAREKALALEGFEGGRIRRFALFPFDVRWCYYTQAPTVWNRPRPSLEVQQWEGNLFIVTRMMAERPDEGVVLTATPCLPDHHLLRPNAVTIPIRHRPVADGKARRTQAGWFDHADDEQGERANLSPAARAYLAALGIDDPDPDAETAGLIWMHALAIGYAPAYLAENGDGIRGDWPRIPLPADREALEASARLGGTVAALLDTESPVPGVTAAPQRPELKAVGVVSRVGGGSLNPAAGDLAITAGWGHPGRAGVVMPGKGKVVARDYTPEELNALRAGAKALGLTPDEALRHLGPTTLDVYLNDVAYWRNVPARVWDYTIGGYQVIKKWLSYREHDLLGRPLRVDEARDVRDTARRLAALLLLEPALDANYAAVREAVHPWSAAASGP
ncbi:MAG TPA: type ISP restriction/modification enzyme [Isosphaeraceae bacterium]|jgi:hypothetical protein|nr:type ISP restriction/modification enzyme [Isosphaeraceae bacterium]